MTRTFFMIAMAMLPQTSAIRRKTSQKDGGAPLFNGLDDLIAVIGGVAAAGEAAENAAAEAARLAKEAGNYLSTYDTCNVNTKELGMQSRWFLVQPGDDDRTPEFDPYILRKLEERSILKTIESTDPTAAPDPDFPCVREYSLKCMDSYLTVVKKKRCGANPATTKHIYFGSRRSIKLCSEIRPTFSPWGKVRTMDVIVMDKNQEEKHLSRGRCVVISTMNPEDGITLSPLDGDMMGDGADTLAQNAPKVYELLARLKDAGAGVVKKMDEIGKEIVSDRKGVVKSSAESSTDEMMDTAVKLIKRMTISSQVDACLCCDKQVVPIDESKASHCMSAYALVARTIAGEKDYALDTRKYPLKTGGETVYMRGPDLMNQLTPIDPRGDRSDKMVTQSQACKFACYMRTPGLFDKYEYGTVCKVPGLAFENWFVPQSYKDWFSHIGLPAPTAAPTYTWQDPTSSTYDEWLSNQVKPK